MPERLSKPPRMLFHPHLAESKKGDKEKDVEKEDMEGNAFKKTGVGT